MEGSGALQERVIQLLEEVLKWTKVTSIPGVRLTLEEVLASNEERTAYQNSTGKTSREVGALVGVGHTTISRWWKRWYRTGLGEMQSVRGGNRFIRSFNLEDFGLEVGPVQRVR